LVSTKFLEYGEVNEIVETFKKIGFSLTFEESPIWTMNRYEESVKDLVTRTMYLIQAFSFKSKVVNIGAGHSSTERSDCDGHMRPIPKHPFEDSSIGFVIFH
jgi:hypothetical protein